MKMDSSISSIEDNMIFENNNKRKKERKKEL